MEELCMGKEVPSSAGVSLIQQNAAKFAPNSQEAWVFELWILKEREQKETFLLQNKEMKQK